VLLLLLQRSSTLVSTASALANLIMEPKDTSTRHFYISLVKSVIRIAAGIALVLGNAVVCGILFVIAEILGIAEEI